MSRITGPINVHRLAFEAQAELARLVVQYFKMVGNAIHQGAVAVALTLQGDLKGSIAGLVAVFHVAKPAIILAYSPVRKPFVMRQGLYGSWPD